MRSDDDRRKVRHDSSSQSFQFFSVRQSYYLFRIIYHRNHRMKPYLPYQHLTLIQTQLEYFSNLFSLKQEHQLCNFDITN